MLFRLGNSVAISYIHRTLDVGGQELKLVVGTWFLILGGGNESLENLLRRRCQRKA